MPLSEHGGRRHNRASTHVRQDACHDGPDPVGIIWQDLLLDVHWHHNDPQCWDQAVMVARRQDVDWDTIYAWARKEGQSRTDIDRLRSMAGK